MSKENKETPKTEKPADPNQRYLDFKWENPDQFRNGPIDDESRKCRDCICCIIFLVIFALCIVVAGFGFYKGKPTQLFYFYDDEGNACGYDEGFKDYKYLYFTNVIGGLKDFDTNKIIDGVCVKICPNETLEKGETYTLDCKRSNPNKNCEVTYENYYQSKILLQRVCFPSSNDEIHFNSTMQYLAKIYDPDSGETFDKVVDKKDIHTDIVDGSVKVYIAQDAINGENDPQKASAKLINLSYFTQLFTLWINDLNVTKYAIFGSIAWSFFLAMFYFLFLRCCAGFITFLCILLVEAGFVVLAVYFYFLADDEEQQEAEGDTTNKAFFWVFVALAAAWLIFILIMCNRIRLAVALTEVTSKYIHKTWCIVFVPFLFFIILVIWLAYWIVLLVFLYTSGDFEKGQSKVK